jgi:hypothetical protein
VGNHDIDPELAQALWEAGKAAARHLGLGEPEYMTICGRGEEIAMQEKTINWRTMTPMQRDDLIHEKVFGHQRQTATHTSRTHAGDSFSYSVTSWQTGGPDTPRYTRSMDAAWLVLQAMVKHYQQSAGKDINPQFEAFADLMLASSEWDSSSAYSEIYPACEIFAIAAKWTPEMIGIAALRALGYEVLTEEGE